MIDATAVLGWAHTKFGRLNDETLESLIGRVATQAIAHAGLDIDDIDEVVISHFNQGMDPQGFPSSLPIQGEAGLLDSNLRRGWRMPAPAARPRYTLHRNRSDAAMLAVCW